MRKVEGNQRHFLLSGRCGLLLPGVRKLGGRLAVKHGRPGKCVQRRNAAKHNTGKPPVRGGSHRSGRTDGANLVSPSSLLNLRPPELFAWIASCPVASCRQAKSFPPSDNKQLFEAADSHCCCCCSSTGDLDMTPFFSNLNANGFEVCSPLSPHPPPIPSFISLLFASSAR